MVLSAKKKILIKQVKKNREYGNKEFAILDRMTREGLAKRVLLKTRVFPVRG